MAATHHSALSLPPPANMERLPSIKELHFSYHRAPPGQPNAAPQNGPEHQQPPPQPAHPPARHENVSWGRAPPPSHPSAGQHSPTMPPPPDHPRQSQQSQQQQQSHKQQDAAYAKQGHPYASQAQLPHGPAPPQRQRTDPSQSSSKRGRSSSTVSASSGRSPHTAYPPGYPQQSPSPFHQVPGAQTPQPPPEPVQQQPPYQPPTSSSAYAYPPQTSQQMAGRQPYPPQAPPQHHQPASRPPAQYHAPQQSQEPWQAPPPAQQPPHQPPPHQPYQQQPPQFENFTRTTPIVPAPVEPRTAVAAPPAPAMADQERVHRDGVLQQIMQYCQMLLGFASKCQQGSQPAPAELRDMTNFAALIVRLLEDLRRVAIPDEKREPIPAPEDSRPPKRPWEDLARDDQNHHPEFSEENGSSTAEQDMEIIRSKRATSSGQSTPGQPKSKYRKRSQRATPPGKCHSCNIRETPEWRRGPDGARTLCNACGLHYAKLMRKRDKALGADGKPIPIDLQTLRASTASSRGNMDANGESSSQGPPLPQSAQQQQQPPQQQQHAQGVAPAQYDTKPGQHPQDGHHHPPPHTAYHLMPGSGQSSPTAGPPPAPPPHMMQPPPRHAHEQAVGGGVPPPPWYVPEQDGAYARSSHPRGSPQ
ncbi:GATA zinc finger domain-containing protein [Phanerochaete sordida]|uniref:GATA zinc finger domain-containing protein n=1 Tax=Phanerochaete sordida TaxID=48140 RepID=A0A9P3LGP8_9APHY|nr:GATA zinc finger domain-containing protein [Phanerochaete sordida]